MPRIQPPAPKERPVSLAVSGAARPPRPALGPSETGGITTRGDDIAVTTLLVLIVLGMLAAARAFMVM